MDYSKLKELALAATTGPWMRLFGERTVYDRMEDGCRGIAIVRSDCSPPSRQEAANIDYIAAANPAAVIALISENEALKLQTELQYQHDTKNKSTKESGDVMTPEEIQAEWDAFIEYPEGSGKLYVTTTSALIFARSTFQCRACRVEERERIANEPTGPLGWKDTL